jgi:hypothetical protein
MNSDGGVGDLENSERSEIGEDKVGDSDTRGVGVRERPMATVEGASMVLEVVVAGGGSEAKAGRDWVSEAQRPFVNFESEVKAALAAETGDEKKGAGVWTGEGGQLGLFFWCWERVRLSELLPTHPCSTPNRLFTATRFVLLADNSLERFGRIISRL